MLLKIYINVTHDPTYNIYFLFWPKKSEKIRPPTLFWQLGSLWKMRSMDLVTVFKKHLFCLNDSPEGSFFSLKVRKPKIKRKIYVGFFLAKINFLEMKILLLWSFLSYHMAENKFKY